MTFFTKRNLLLIISIQFVIIFILGLATFNKPLVRPVSFNSKPYIDTISKLTDNNHKLDLIIKNLNKDYSLLEIKKNEIHTQYVKKVKFIYTANPHVLDSIIRANY